ncbi:AbrB/MazE/SpoVT family DNA-binding domain-containing protein [Candidatus Woesearchaeota archaeon]|nr:AbrB/MazE/SpoVT family DNA-binding domain-containing protein [Candidatus Woesearchaeota archaeon]
MKRKIIKLGTATLVASLPSKWIKRFNIKQGDEVEVEERGNELVIATQKHSQNEQKLINITDLDTKLVARYILSSYILGCDEMKIRFENNEILNIKHNTKIPTMNFIQQIVNTKLIGVEVIEQKGNYCIIKDLTGTAENEFNRVIRRVFLLIMSMSEELLTNIKESNINNVKNVEYSRENIDRFINFCLRILNKKGHEDFQKTPLYYHIVMELRHITQVYEYIGKEFTRRKKPVKKELIEALNEINIAFKTYYESFYKYDKDKALELVKVIRKYYDMVNSVQYSEEPQYSHDVLLVGRMTMLAVDLMNLAELKISLEL